MQYAFRVTLIVMLKRHIPALGIRKSQLMVFLYIIKTKKMKLRSLKYQCTKLMSKADTYIAKQYLVNQNIRVPILCKPLKSEFGG